MISNNVFYIYIYMIFFLGLQMHEKKDKSTALFTVLIRIRDKKIRIQMWTLSYLLWLLFFRLFLVYTCAPCTAAATWPCEGEQTEAGVPLYLFQVWAHCRPVALQRKPRYSTLAKRKGRGYFRDGFIEDVIILILPPTRAQSQRGGVRSSGGGIFFYELL